MLLPESSRTIGGLWSFEKSEHRLIHFGTIWTSVVICYNCYAVWKTSSGVLTANHGAYEAW